MSGKARAQAEKFSWDKVAEKYEDLMLALVDMGRGKFEIIKK